MNNDNEYDHYSVIMEWDPTDRIYVVTVPELPGCMTHGASLEEAAQQAKDAIETWVDGAREDGETLPQARHFDLDCHSHIVHSNQREYSHSQKAS